MANVVTKMMGKVHQGISKGSTWQAPVVTPNYSQAASAGGFGHLLFSGATRIGLAAGLGFVSNFFFRRLKKAPPGAPISRGKRGIDGNNMNAAGVSLAMHRNRRSH